MLFGTRFRFINQWTWQNQAKHCFTRCGNIYSVKLLGSNKLSKIPEITVWHFEWLCSPHWNFVAQNMWFATITKFSRVKSQNLEICAKIYLIWSIHLVLDYLFQLNLWRHIAIALFIPLFTIHPSQLRKKNSTTHQMITLFEKALIAIWHVQMWAVMKAHFQSTCQIQAPGEFKRLKFIYGISRYANRYSALVTKLSQYFRMTLTQPSNQLCWNSLRFQFQIIVAWCKLFNHPKIASA